MYLAVDHTYPVNCDAVVDVHVPYSTVYLSLVVQHGTVAGSGEMTAFIYAVQWLDKRDSDELDLRLWQSLCRVYDMYMVVAEHQTYEVSLTILSCVRCCESVSPLGSFPREEMKMGGVSSLDMHSAIFRPTPPYVCTRLPRFVPSL